MAKRLATEYVNICLHVPEEDLSSLDRMLQQIDGAASHIQELTNGKRAVKLCDPESGESITLHLEKAKGGRWIQRASCRLNNPNLARTMQRIIRKFKGDAISHRIYSNFTVVYCYAKGQIAKILEISENQQKIVYENKNVTEQLAELYQRQDVESQIHQVYRMIDKLLDSRLQTDSAAEQNKVDSDLKDAVRKLFYLEA